jgi:molybdopterin converting factor small subunit
MIKVLFFAHLRDLAKVNQIIVDRGDMTHVRDLLTNFIGELPHELIEALSDETAMVSVNQKYAGWDAELPDFSEVGILPPVSGG